MKHTKKRVAALLLTLAMVLSLMPMAFAADFEDMPAEDDASYAAVKSAVDNGLLKGEDGKLNLEGSMTRATMAALITRVFGAKGEADMSAFSDAEGHWAVESGELPAAVAMGIMNGSNGKMLPNDQVTLEQVITMLVRALGLPMGTADDLKDVAGADSVTAWAVPYVAALVKAGYDVPDLAGAAEPMTRVAFTEMIYKVSGEGNYVKEAGEITEDVDGNIIITADGVSLKGITVKGDVIIADGVDAGSIVLDGAKVEGRLVVRGGQDVSLTNGATAASTVVAKPAGELTVKADDSSDAGAITVTGTDNKAAEKVTVDMAEPKVTVEAGTTLAVQNAKGGEVTLKADGAKVAVESGTVANVTVADGAKDVAVDVAKDATIEKVTTNTDLAVTGEGTVTEKEGSGTVTDAAGNEVEGSDEPADVPVVTTPSTPDEETDPNAPKNENNHTHNYGAATQFDATRHIYTCVVTAEGAETPIEGCGAVKYEAHSFDEETGACVCGAKKPGTVATEGIASDPTEKPDGWKACGATGAEHEEHSWVAKAKEGDVAATCAAVGKKSYECEYCKSTKTDTIAKLEHSYQVDAAQTQAATCGAQGTMVYVCTSCAAGADGHTKPVTIPATGEHKWVQEGYAEDHEPTCQAEGKYHYVCSVCSAEDDNQVAPKVGHDWNTTGTHKEGTNTHEVTCQTAQCTAKKIVNCSFTVAAQGQNAAAKDATCEEVGKAADMKCSGCDNVLVGKEIPAKGHVWAKGWASDENDHWHACGNDETHKKDVTAHTWDKTKEGNPVAGAKCTVCGYAYEGGSATTPTHEHIKAQEWSKDADGHWHACTGTGTCPDNNKCDAASHSWTGGGEDQAGHYSECSYECHKDHSNCTTEATKCTCGFINAEA